LLIYMSSQSDAVISILKKLRYIDEIGALIVQSLMTNIYLTLSIIHIYLAHLIMSSTITQILDSLFCFRKQPQVIEVVTTTCSLETKQSKRSSASFISLEKDARTKLEQSFPSESKLVSRYNRALAVVGKKEHAVLETYPYPILHHEKELIISTRAVGLNPIDWKSVDYNFCLPELPWITGREMAGVVEQVGSEVTKFKVGQRVWTSMLLTF